jgi:hypothetical protein
VGTVLVVLLLSQRRYENLAKHCRFDKTQFCWRKSCDVILSSGEVTVCALYRGGDKFASREVSSSHISIFELLKGRDKHSGRGF